MSNIHLIGIGGSGLSAIATVLLQQNHTVSGSDRQASAMTERLAGLGAKIFIGHRPENLGDNLDVVIISSAIPADNPELVEARRRGVTVVKRSEWLGQMMAGYTGLAIAGTHGKTTTTAMTAFVLREAGHDPTFIVGGFMPQLQTNAAAGQGSTFVIEADEYDYMFLGLRPTMAVVTIVEWDHPDMFPTPQAFQQAFIDFVRLVPPTGLVIGGGDDPGTREVINQAQAPVVTYGLQPGNDWQAVDLRPNVQGGYDFSIITAEVAPVTVSLRVPGVHNIRNALAVLIMAHRQGLDLAQAAGILSRFEGVGRRFEFKGEVNGITVIDDYAHHPTEIKATLAAARARFGARPLWVVIQPHTFSRTRALLDEFATAFDEADQVIVVDIFASREVDEGLVSSRDLVARLRHPAGRYIGDLQQAAAYLVNHLAAGDVLLTFGAGDSYRVGEWVLAGLSKNEE